MFKLAPIFSDCPPCPATCPMCAGDKVQQTSYCDPVVRRSALPSGTSRGVPKDPTRESLLAEADARMEAAAKAVMATVAQNVGASRNASSGASNANSGSSTPSRRRGPKATRRTSAQVKRAAEQQAREAVYRDAQITRGTVLEGQLEAEESWVASLKEEA